VKPSEILKAGLELLGPEGKHWAGFRNSNSAGYECTTTCIARVARGWNDECDVLDVLYKMFNTTTLGTIWRWNDAPERTFPEIKAKFLEAIALAEEVESNV
jgi:hypothetical protein